MTERKIEVRSFQPATDDSPARWRYFNCTIDSSDRVTEISTGNHIFTGLQCDRVGDEYALSVVRKVDGFTQLGDRYKPASIVVAHHIRTNCLYFLDDELIPYRSSTGKDFYLFNRLDDLSIASYNSEEMRRKLGCGEIKHLMFR